MSQGFWETQAAEYGFDVDEMIHECEVVINYMDGDYYKNRQEARKEARREADPKTRR